MQRALAAAAKYDFSEVRARVSSDGVEFAFYRAVPEREAGAVEETWSDDDR
jgi:hypothetical protein